MSSQKNPSCCGILRVVGTACGDRQPSKRPGVWLRDENWSLWNCGRAAGRLRGVWGGWGNGAVGRLRGGCGAAGAMGLRGGCGAVVGWLRDGCGVFVGAVGRLLRGGCGAAAGRLRAGHKNGGIRARRFRAGWGGTPADWGVHENAKNCGIRARRFLAGWGDTPAAAGVREKCVGSGGLLNQLICCDFRFWSHYQVTTGHYGSTGHCEPLRHCGSPRVTASHRRSPRLTTVRERFYFQPTPDLPKMIQCECVIWMSFQVQKVSMKPHFWVAKNRGFAGNLDLRK